MLSPRQPACGRRQFVGAAVLCAAEVRAKIAALEATGRPRLPGKAIGRSL